MDYFYFTPNLLSVFLSLSYTAFLSRTFGSFCLSFHTMSVIWILSEWGFKLTKLPLVVFSVSFLFHLSFVLFHFSIHEALRRHPLCYTAGSQTRRRQYVFLEPAVPARNLSITFKNHLVRFLNIHFQTLHEFFSKTNYRVRIAFRADTLPTGKLWIFSGSCGLFCVWIWLCRN